MEHKLDMIGKAKDRAFINFKTYIEKAPDGRFAIRCVCKILPDCKISALFGYDCITIYFIFQ